MYYFLFIFSYLVAVIPVEIYAYFARFLRILFYDFFGLRKKLILKNLRLVFSQYKSPEEIQVIGKKCFENFIITTFECLRGVHKNLIENVTFANREVLDEIMKRGRGVYILVWHGANWEALAASVGVNFSESYVPVKKVGGVQTNKFVTNFRLKYRVNSLISLHKGYTTKKIIEVLCDNKAVGFMQDQARPGEPYLPFFGIPAKTNTSLAAIWSKQKAPVLGAYIVRTEPNRHVVTFMPEVMMSETKNPERDILDNTLKFNRVLEQGILLNPEQYFWLHNRWKS